MQKFRKLKFPIWGPSRIQLNEIIPWLTNLEIKENILAINQKHESILCRILNL